MFSCNQNDEPSQEKQTNIVTEQQDTEQIIVEATPLEKKTTDNIYLITNTSIGLFSIKTDWKTACQKYDYNKTNSEECVDACCEGTTILWEPNISMDKPSIVLYNKYVDDKKIPEHIKMDCREYSKVHGTRKDLFFVCSDNCPSWYYKDSITGLAVYSPNFKTKENIGVGSKLEDFLKAFNTVYLTVGWIEEDADAIQLSVDEYPNLIFVVNSDLYNSNWEPAPEDKIGDEYNYKILLHNTDCFTGGTTIRKIIAR